MNSLNSTTSVSPTSSVARINDFLRLHKPDELPSSVVASASFTSHVSHHAVTDGTAILPGGSSGSDSSSDPDRTASTASGATASSIAADTNAALLANSNVTFLNQILSVAQATSGGGSNDQQGSGGPLSNSSTNSNHKLCPYHRQCSSHHHHLHRHLTVQQHHHQQQAGVSAAGSSLVGAFGPYRNTGSPSNSGSSVSYPLRDAISTNVSPPPLNAVILVDRYLLMEPVEGNNLYRCFDIKSHEELVCKIANNPCSNLITAHFRLDGHPHVNSLHKVIRGNNQTYLLFSPSEGDLHSHVRRRKRLREPEARRLCRQMCEVVKSCHEQGIVLRDLKLRKFVFADRGRTQLKLESLEDAVVLDDPAEDLLQDKRGCPAYVSPEILRANTTYSGKAADMWSLGVILYTMLVGRYPFNDSEHASLFAKISRGQFTVPECLSSKARCIIRALLRRDPEERIASEDVLFHPWLLHDDSKDHGYGLHSSKSGPAADDHCVPEWFDPSEESEDSKLSSFCRLQYSGSGDTFDN
ncbi:tribbles homolog 2-like [Anopheles nili]|uniref:tribbles homolog 2-like n=1 Tax=Anopheles nili TaxID=185578 RepID=UPI00237C1F3D|nr:tribbles homolog 2-like [Anopheles nili]